MDIADIVREAREVKRLAGGRAHVFFWLSGHLYDKDPALRWLGLRLFEGVKLHEGETPWMRNRQKDLRRVLSVAAERGFRVMFHAGPGGGCRPSKLAKLAREFPSVRFDFAHCRPMAEMAKVIADCPNVWSDTAYMALDEIPKLSDFHWHNRLMFGTDLPVWQSNVDCSLTDQYRAYIQAFRKRGFVKKSEVAFHDYLGDMRINHKVLCESKQEGDENWEVKV
ncbi:MAG: amidohydrolase family protein [Kiritimatiellia bacterium]